MQAGLVLFKLFPIIAKNDFANGRYRRYMLIGDRDYAQKSIVNGAITAYCNFCFCNESIIGRQMSQKNSKRRSLSWSPGNW